jgi:hypothetical protein
MRESAHAQEAPRPEGDAGYTLAIGTLGVPIVACLWFTGTLLWKAFWQSQIDPFQISFLSLGFPLMLFFAGPVAMVLGFQKPRLDFKKTWASFCRSWVMMGPTNALVWLLFSFPLAGIIQGVQMPREPVSPGLVWAGAWSQIGWPLGVAALLFVTSWIAGVRQK